MNWRTVDMSRESRRDQFAYFQTLSNPYVGVTVQVDVTELAVWCRESGTSFFLAVLYAAVRAANGVPELRRRIRGDQVVEYDRCPSSHTPADSNPRITWGRWHRQEGRTLLPMTLLANHALVDGIHIARFYENLDRELAALCGGEKTEY